MERYSNVDPEALIIYPYREGPNGTPVLIPAGELESTYPNIYRHLLGFKDELRERKDSRKYYARGVDSYRHLHTGSFAYINPSKLALKGIARRSSVGLLREKTAFDGARCPCIIIEEGMGHDQGYFLAVLNSKLAGYCLRAACPAKLSGYIEFSASCISEMPIRVIDFRSGSDRKTHDDLVRLALHMVSLREQSRSKMTAHDQTMLQRQVHATDRQIDQLVYGLYGLTDGETQIVEDSFSAKDETEEPTELDDE